MSARRQDGDGRLHAASGHNLFDGTDCTWQGEVPFLIRDVSVLSPPAFPVMPWLCAEMLWPMPVKKVVERFFAHHHLGLDIQGPGSQSPGCVSPCDQNSGPS